MIFIINKLEKQFGYSVQFDDTVPFGDFIKFDDSPQFDALVQFNANIVTFCCAAGRRILTLWYIELNRRIELTRQVELKHDISPWPSTIYKKYKNTIRASIIYKLEK